MFEKMCCNINMIEKLITGCKYYLYDIYATIIHQVIAYTCNNLQTYVHTICTFVHIVVRYDVNKSMSLRVQYESGNFRKYYATLINWQMDHTNAGSCLLIFFCQMRDVGIDQAVVMVTPLDHPP